MTVLSVIIPTLNEGENLVRTVRSVLENPPSEPFEVLVVDDASDDGSTAFLEDGVPHTRWLRDHPTRQGLARAKNHGARAARGELLLFLDAHSSVEPGALDQQIAAVRESDGRALVGLALRGLTPDFRPLPTVHGTAMGFDRRLDMRWQRLLAGNRSPILSGSGMMVARDFFFDGLGAFDDGIFEWGVENIEISVKAWLVGEGCLVLPRLSFGHVFKPVFQYAVSHWKFVYAKLRAAAILFPDEVRARVHEALAGPGLERAAELLRGEADSVRARREAMLARAHRPFEDYLELSGLTL